jgi:uncharacterized protein (TIGR02145 family)
MINRIYKFIPVFLFSVVVSCEQMGIQPDPNNTPPEVRFAISPSIGDSTQSFTLNGSGSHDKEDMLEFLLFRWDFNNDSIWDTDYIPYPYLIKHFPVPGSYRIRMQVSDRHGLTDEAEVSLTSYGFNHDTAHFVDPRDGQTYRTVRIGGVWWMSENLNFGITIRDTQMARDNGIYEKYSYQNNPDLKGADGGYYTYYHWDEVINYDTLGVQGLCPPGWKLPEMSDWDTLRNPLRSRGNDYLSAGGFSALNLTKIGIHELTKLWETIDECPCTGYWMYLTRSFKKDFYRRGYRPCPMVISSGIVRAFTQTDRDLIRFVNDSIHKNGGALPVRCIKIDR